LSYVQSQGKPENINVDFTSRVKEYIENYKKYLLYNELTDKPFCVKEIKKCITILHDLFAIFSKIFDTFSVALLTSSEVFSKLKFSKDTIAYIDETAAI
jgi:hypothetical protein